MAYDASRKKQNEQQNEAENPYSALTSATSYQAPVSSPVIMNLSASPAWRPKGAGPSATGYVNFDRIYGANAQVSERESRARTSAAEQKAKAAQQGLSGAVRDFNKGLTGATQGMPTQAQQDWARYGSTGVTQPKEVRGAHYTTSGQTNVLGENKPFSGQSINIPEANSAIASANVPQVVQVANDKQDAVRATNEDQLNHETQTSEGLDSGGYTRNSGPDEDPGEFLDPANQANWADEVRRGAAAEYGGPMGLSDSERYDQLLKDTVEAEDLAQNPLHDVSGMDADLLGAAGRPEIERLKRQYGGLKENLNKANEQSYKNALAARDSTSAAAKAYQDLLDEYEGRVGADEKRAGDISERNDSIIQGARDDAAARARFDDYLNHRTAGETLRNTLHGVANALSPSARVFEGMGMESPVDALTDKLSPGGPDNKGNASSVWTDADYEVFASMSQADWDEFNALPPEKQRAWIEARRAKLKGGK